MFPFAENTTPLDLEPFGETGIGRSEYAGVQFSPFGRWLFCHLQYPGTTYAITGPGRKDVCDRPLTIVAAVGAALAPRGRHRGRCRPVPGCRARACWTDADAFDGAAGHRRHDRNAMYAWPR